ncbi:MAG: hypothetical protein GW834_15005 [Cyanobacteria bacterium]|nr:hypothetical protein [Cyanobacteria bacterium CG_2015-09_32_10]
MINKTRNLSFLKTFISRIQLSISVILVVCCFTIETKAQTEFSYYKSFPEYQKLNSLANSEFDKNDKPVGKLFETFRTKPGAAFFGSLILPGFSQAVNEKWIRSAVYLIAEAGVIVAHQLYLNEGRNGEKDYRNFIDQNWSVQKYAEYVVDYNNRYNPDYQDNPLTINDLANANANLTVGNFGFGRSDWGKIDIAKLRALESETKYQKNSWNSASTSFSHPLPNYGSQQYYELVAKYFQFGPGWGDFNTSIETITWTLQDMSSQFQEASNKSTSFNNSLRTASRLTSLIILNHVISAFDGYFTVKLKNFELSQNQQIRMVTGFSFGIPF